MAKDKRTLQELEDDLRSLVQSVTPDVKQYWQRGERTTSVLIECNIDKANDAIEKGNRKQMEIMEFILNQY